VAVCHKGKQTIKISAAAVQAHLDHGDTLGPCDQKHRKGKKHRGDRDNDHKDRDRDDTDHDHDDWDDRDHHEKDGTRRD
jgi:hypothetical protein